MNTKWIERSGMNIEKSGTGIEQSGTGLRLFTTVRTILIGLLIYGSAASATQNTDADAPTYGGNLSLGVVGNDELLTFNFKDGYRVVGGYGYVENDYAQISLYSLEYVNVINADSNSSDVGLSSYGQGTGSASNDPEDDPENGPGSETAPTYGQGTGTSSEGSVDEQLKAWGIAEVVLSERGIADLIVYQFNGEGTLEEVGVYSGVEVH